MKKLREKFFLNDIDFLKDITNITISFGDEPELNELPMCYRYVNLVLIFSSKFQINIIKNVPKFL